MRDLEERTRSLVSAWRPEYHQCVTDADPLGVDIEIGKLPLLNRDAEVGEIVQLLRRIAPAPERVMAYTFFEAAAAMRDLGMCLGSIKRHGVQPLDVFPELTPSLQLLGALTHMPPRDTLLHYTLWNPATPRERVYTLAPEERCLIESVRMAVPAVEQAVPLLVQMGELSVCSEQFGVLARQCLAHLRVLVEVVIYTRQHVPPRTFVEVLRPYFEPIHIDGQEHRGPGAVEMPLFLVDHILWSSLLADPRYVEFKERYVCSLLPHLREHYRRYRERPSIIDRVDGELRACGERSAICHENLQLLSEILRVITRFRAPHLGMAYQAYSKREGSAYSHGSGGYSPPTLAMILDHTRDAHARILRLIDPHAPEAAGQCAPAASEVHDRVVVNGASLSL